MGNINDAEDCISSVFLTSTMRHPQIKNQREFMPNDRAINLRNNAITYTIGGSKVLIMNNSGFDNILNNYIFNSYMPKNSDSMVIMISDTIIKL
jgi:hypothetical protein